MIKIDVKKEGSIDKALKKLKLKVKNTKLFKELSERREFNKPSVKKRKQKLKAIKREKDNRNLNQQ